MASSLANDDLISKASARFSEKALSDAEKRLLKGAPNGEIAVCGPKLDDSDDVNDPAKSEGWGSDREIRADLIRWICTDREVALRIDPRGIQVYGGKVTRTISLSHLTVSFPPPLLRSVF